MSHRQRLEILKAELESSRLEVVLVPLNPRLRGFNEGGCKRVVCSKNVSWYRAFCNRHPSSRGVRRGKFDTRIRRLDVLTILDHLCAGRKTRSKYAPELIEMAEVAA
jgi:hypothetical protein